MYKNETVLTPLFRYVIWCIEKNEECAPAQACTEIRNFLDNKKIEYPKEPFNFGQMADRTIQLLEMKSCDHSQAYSFWKKECERIAGESCEMCIFCKKCRSYFWYELGEILLQKPNVMKQSGCYLPIRRIPEKIERHFHPSKKAVELYFYNHQRNKAKIMDGCIILKGMSSSTPSLLNSIYDTNQFSGGGFYLRYHGIGVAIDPGYHFLDNLHHYGLSVLDIHAVVITHEHIDHNNDMRLLDDLHQAACRYVQDEKRRKIVWYLDAVSYQVAEIYQQNGTGFNKDANILCCISPKIGGDLTEAFMISEDDAFRLRCFPTKHIGANGTEFKEHTFGCQFEMGKEGQCRYLVYTSDTRYFPELVQYINMPDLLIANISGIYEDDFMLVKQKKRHLGYYGCYYLLTDIWKRFKKMPDLVMLSEFWNGENDIRFDVAAFLEKQLQLVCGKDSLRIVPAEVGMAMQVSDGSVRCSKCGNYTKHFLISKPNGYKEKIKVLCKSCIY